MESFSTQGLPAAKKASYWNEITSEIFARMEIEPYSQSRFDGSLNREQVGPVTLVDVFSAAARIHHTRAHIARMTTPSYLLLAPLQRQFELSVDNSPPVSVRAGEFCLIDHAHPYELVHGDAVRTLCVDIPRHCWNARFPESAHLVGRLMRPDTSVSRLLIGLLGNLGEELVAGGAATLSPAVGQTLLDLVTAAYSGCVEAASALGVNALAKAIRTHIDSRLMDAELAPADVALHFGISERYLRKVLSASAEPFSAYVLRRRLERCASLLRCFDHRRLTITRIALECGFSNPTHFGAAFKTRYGVTPRDYRRDSARGAIQAIA